MSQFFFLKVKSLVSVIYEGFRSDVAQGRVNGALNEIRTHSWTFASLAC